MSESENPDGLTEAQREEVERLVEERSSGVEIGRRGVLGGIAAAAGVGAMSGGAAGQSGGGQESMALGGSLSVDDTYQISGNWYAGPESAKPSNPDTSDQLFWTVTDAKSGHVLRWEYWDGSAWVQTGQQVQDLHSESINTDHAGIGTIEYNTQGEQPTLPRMPTLDGPLAFKPHGRADNPTITIDHTDLTGSYVADPIAGVVDGSVYLLYEALDSNDEAEIVYSTSPTGINNWTYGGRVLDASQNLSWPIWFQHDGDWYLIVTPSDELWVHKEQTLSDLLSSPTRVEQNTNFNTGELRDGTPFIYDGHWYMIAGDVNNNNLILYESESLVDGSWNKHPESPLINASQKIKIGSPPHGHAKQIDIYPQINDGDRMEHHRITNLSPTTATVTKLHDRILGRTNNGWHDTKIHTISPIPSYVNGEPVVIIDGKNSNGVWQIGAFTTTDLPWTKFKGTLPSTTSISGFWNSIDFGDTGSEQGIDTQQAYNETSDTYVIPDSGTYRISAHFELSFTSGSPFYAGVQIYDVTNSTVLDVGWSHASVDDNCSLSVPPSEHRLDAGTEIEVRVGEGNGGVDVTTGFHGTWVNIERVE